MIGNIGKTYLKKLSQSEINVEDNFLYGIKHNSTKRSHIQREMPERVISDVYLNDIDINFETFAEITQNSNKIKYKNTEIQNKSDDFLNDSFNRFKAKSQLNFLDVKQIKEKYKPKSEDFNSK